MLRLVVEIEGARECLVRDEWRGIVLRVCNESNGEVKALGHSVSVKCSLKSPSQPLNMIGGQSLVALTASLPTSHKEEQRLTAQVPLNDRGFFRGFVKVLKTCTGVHYNGSHSSQCYHRITHPLLFHFEAHSTSPSVGSQGRLGQAHQATRKPLPQHNKPSSSPSPSPSSSHAAAAIPPPQILDVICGPITIHDPLAPSATPTTTSTQHAPELAAALHRAYELSGGFSILLAEQEVMDGFGHVIWDAAFLLVKHLEQLGPKFLRGKRCIEVGSGVGLVGIAAASLGADIVLTDMPSALHLTQLNVERNRALVTQKGGAIKAQPLAWGTSPSHLQAPYRLVLASDVVYDNDLFPPLIATLVSLCDSNTEVLLSARERHGCDFTLFLSQLGEKFHCSILQLEGGAAVLAEASVISKAKQKPHIYRLRLKG